MVKSKTKVSNEKETETHDADAPLIDNDAALKKMIKKATAQGFITHAQRDQVLTSDKYSTEQIEDIMSQLSEMGINVIEHDEDADAEGG